MAKSNNIPSKVRDVYVRNQAYKLLNCIGFTSLPIDPFIIIESFGWNAYTVEEAEAFGVECPFNLNESSPAISFRIHMTGEWFIIYHDEKHIPRLRWSIAHEIGHIFLEHKNEFPNRLTEEEYKIAEIEANLFASELLAPTRIIISDMFPRTEVALLCNISLEATNKVLDKFKGIYKMNALTILSRESEELYQNMYNYLLEISNYWENRLKETDIILLQQYEDYIFCNYWEYVKSKMKRDNKKLFIMIDDSIVFYDNTEMILLVRNREAASLTNTEKKHILGFLTKYTNSSIRNIVSIQVIV